MLKHFTELFIDNLFCVFVSCIKTKSLNNALIVSIEFCKLEFAVEVFESGIVPKRNL